MKTFRFLLSLAGTLSLAVAAPAWEIKGISSTTETNRVFLECPDESAPLLSSAADVWVRTSTEASRPQDFALYALVNGTFMAGSVDTNAASTLVAAGTQIPLYFGPVGITAGDERRIEVSWSDGRTVSGERLAAREGLALRISFVDPAGIRTESCRLELAGRPLTASRVDTTYSSAAVTRRDATIEGWSASSGDRLTLSFTNEFGISQSRVLLVSRESRIACQPNPFSPPTGPATFQVPLGKEAEVKSIRVTTLGGSFVCELPPSARSGSTGEIRWNGRTSSGRPLASGLYRLSVRSLAAGAETEDHCTFAVHSF